MKIKFDEWGEWSEAVASVAQYGTVDGRPFVIAYAGTALAELFGVANEPYVLEYAFMRNQAFMNEISLDIIESGRLRADYKVVLYKKDLIPYFERRAATATAPA